MAGPRVVIIDYELGNLFSVRRALTRVGAEVVISSNPEELRGADGVVLPGVGAFGRAMANLERLNLVGAILRHVGDEKPLFGICLGLQLLFERSEEFGEPVGLGVLRGNVRRLPVSESPVPQIGWNRVAPRGSLPNGFADSPMRGVTANDWMYFVHSYYVDAGDPLDALCTTTYAGFTYTSAVRRSAVFATQFHPEKSGACGLSICREWVDAIR